MSLIPSQFASVQSWQVFLGMAVNLITLTFPLIRSAISKACDQQRVGAIFAGDTPFVFPVIHYLSIVHPLLPSPRLCTVGQNNQEYRLQYWATRSYVCSFACSLALLTRLLAPPCSLRLRALLQSLVCLLSHFAHSRARGKVSY